MNVTVSFARVYKVQYDNPFEMTKEEAWNLSEKYASVEVELQSKKCLVKGLNFVKLVVMKDRVYDFPIVEPIQVTFEEPMVDQSILDYLAPYRVSVNYLCNETKTNANELNISEIRIANKCISLSWVDPTKIEGVVFRDQGGRTEGFDKLMPYITHYRNESSLFWGYRMKGFDRLEYFHGTVDVAFTLLGGGSPIKHFKCSYELRRDEVLKLFEFGVKKVECNHELILNKDDLAQVQGMIIISNGTYLSGKDESSLLELL